MVRAPLITTDTSRVIGVRAARQRRPTTTFTRGVVIAADGRHSKIALRHGARAVRALAPGGGRSARISSASTVCRRMAKMHIRARQATSGSRRLPGDVANVCVVRELQEHVPRPARQRRERRSTSRCEATRSCGERFARAPGLGRDRASVRSRSIAGPSAIRVCCCAGDAAGFIDPMTGDGLRFADPRRRARRGSCAARAVHRRRRLHASPGGARERVRPEVADESWASRRSSALRAAVGAASQVAKQWQAPGPACSSVSRAMSTSLQHASVLRSSFRSPRSIAVRR